MSDQSIAHITEIKLLKKSLEKRFGKENTAKWFMLEEFGDAWPENIFSCPECGSHSWTKERLLVWRVKVKGHKSESPPDIPGYERGARSMIFCIKCRHSFN